jgi:precorrin isomerase
MPWFRPEQSPQLFGELLVKNHLVTQDQLARAIEQQHDTGQRLGEILSEWHLITQQNVQEMLRTQRNLRVAAAFVAAIFAPLESYAAEGAAPTAFTQTLPLDESRLDKIAAQGLGPNNDLKRQVNQQLHDNGVEVVGNLDTLLDPVMRIVEADFTPELPLSMPGPASSSVSADGAISLSVPFTAGQMSVRNVVVHGSSTTQQSIDFRTTIIQVDKKP